MLRQHLNLAVTTSTRHGRFLAFGCRDTGLVVPLEDAVAAGESFCWLVEGSTGHGALGFIVRTHPM